MCGRGRAGVYGRSAPLNMAVECSSSPQHWGSNRGVQGDRACKGVRHADPGPGSGKTEISCFMYAPCSFVLAKVVYKRMIIRYKKKGL